MDALEAERQLEDDGEAKKEWPEIHGGSSFWCLVHRKGGTLGPSIALKQSLDLLL